MTDDGANANHIPSAPVGCPVFDRVMDALFRGHAKYKDVVMEKFAASMLKKYTVREMYVHYGNGSNGKSTCLSVMRRLLSEADTRPAGTA